MELCEAMAAEAYMFLITQYDLGAYISKVLVILLIFNRDSDKMIFERLQKEFEAARASQTEGSFVFNASHVFNAFGKVALVERYM